MPAAPSPRRSPCAAWGAPLAAALLGLLLAGPARAGEPAPAPEPEALAARLLDPAGPEAAGARRVLLEVLSRPGADEYLARFLAAYARALGAARDAAKDEGPLGALVPRIYELDELAQRSGRAAGDLADSIREASGAVQTRREGARLVVIATEAGHAEALRRLERLADAAGARPAAVPGGKAPGEPPATEPRPEGAVPLPPSGPAPAPAPPPSAGPRLSAWLVEVPEPNAAAPEGPPSDPLTRALGHPLGAGWVALPAQEVAATLLRLRQIPGVRVERLAEGLSLVGPESAPWLGPSVPYRRALHAEAGSGYRVSTGTLESGWRFARAAPSAAGETGLWLRVEHRRVGLTPVERPAPDGRRVPLDRPEIEVAARTLAWDLPAAGGGALLDATRILPARAGRALLVLEAAP